MPKKGSKYHDEYGNAYKLINVKHGKHEHPAFILSGGPESTVCTIRWSSNDTEAQVETSTINFDSMSGKRTRRKPEKYKPPSTDAILDVDGSTEEQQPTKKRQKLATKISLTSLAPDESIQQTTTPRSSLINKTTKTKKKITTKQAFKQRKDVQDESDPESSDDVMQTTYEKNNADILWVETPPTVKRYVPGFDDTDESSSTSSEPEKKSDRSDEEPDEESDDQPEIKPVRQGLRDRNVRKSHRASFNEENFTYSTSRSHLVPVLNVMIQPEATISHSRLEQANVELAPFLNRHGTSILASKSADFIDTIVMENNVKSCELLLLSMQKLNHSNAAVVQKIFDFYEPELSPIRRLYLGWLPYTFQQIKNKRYNAVMKLKAREYQYAEKVEESLACEILYLIRTINFRSHQLFTKTQKDFSIEFTRIVDQAMEIANEYVIRPLLDACVDIKDYLNALKLGQPPPPPRKKYKSVKKSQKKIASQKVIVTDEGTMEASESNVVDDVSNANDVTTAEASQVACLEVTHVSTKKTGRSDTFRDNVLTAVLDVEEANAYNFLV